jgi:hypothetical protein
LVERKIKAEGQSRSRRLTLDGIPIDVALNSELNPSSLIDDDMYRGVANACPPTVVVHLFEMKPVVDDELVEDSLILELDPTITVLGKDAPASAG